MTDPLDRDLRAKLTQASLPRAPEELRARLLAVAATPAPAAAPAARVLRRRRLALGIGFAALALIAGTAAVLTLGSPRPLLVVDGLPVLTVSEALAAHEAGGLPDGRAAVRGFWSNGQIGHMCAPSREQTGELELYCTDGEYGITELNEPILVIDQFGYETYRAEGPHLTPWFPSDLEGVDQLFDPTLVNGQRLPPIPIVVVGHFDDPRAANCGPAARQLCLDRLVLERIVSFARASVQLPAVTPSPTPFPSPPPAGLFEPSACAGDVPYSFVGWTTQEVLGINRGMRGHLWAVITRDPIDRTEGKWQDDPNGSGHRYLLFAQLVCFAEESPHDDGAIGYENIPGTEYVLWDDGLKGVGPDPARPADESTPGPS